MKTFVHEYQGDKQIDLKEKDLLIETCYTFNTDKKWTGNLSALFSLLVRYFAELMVIRTKVRMLSL